jgi:hypothetical protein
MRHIVESDQNLVVEVSRPNRKDVRRRSSRLTHRGILVAASLLLLGTTASAQPPSTGGRPGKQSDDFEFKPMWTITAQNGSVGLSSDRAHSGATAAVLSSRSGGQRNIWLEHAFPAPKKGTLSVWFLDTAPGFSTLYSGLYAFNLLKPTEQFSVNVADWNPTTYVWSGPGIGETATSVPRTLGWHEFKLEVTPTEFNAYIDGIVVGSVSGDFAFDSVRLLLQGPGSRPDATFYFDDFQYRGGELPM